MRRQPLTVFAITCSLAAGLQAQARPVPRSSAEKPPVPVDTAVVELAPGVTGSSYGAVARHLASAGPGGFYLIRLPVDSICEDHPIKPAYDEGRGQLKVVFDGGHSNATPGIELLCSRRIVGAIDVSPPGAPKFRASRIIDQAGFVMPAEKALRWQSHFDVPVTLAVTPAEGPAAAKRLAYYLVLEPALVDGVGPAQRDSTHEAATPDTPDDVTRVQQTIWATGVWLWVVERQTRKVVGKGPLLPGSCP
jgi:hypothetical protein